MSFYTSLSGLQAAQTDMSTISHKPRERLDQRLQEIAHRIRRRDRIVGVAVADADGRIGRGREGQRQHVRAGQPGPVGQRADLAISGDGFFAVKPNVDAAGISFTRNGGFMVDTNRYVVDGNGGHLQVYPVDGSARSSHRAAIRRFRCGCPRRAASRRRPRPSSTARTCRPTAKIPTTAEFDRFDPSSYNQSTQSTVYDASGNALTMTSYFKRETALAADGTGTSTWSVHSFVGDQALSAGGNDFPDAELQRGRRPDQWRHDAVRCVHPRRIGRAAADHARFRRCDDAARIALHVAARSQNGAAVGQLQGVTVDGEGLVKASFSTATCRISARSRWSISAIRRACARPAAAIGRRRPVGRAAGRRGGAKVGWARLMSGTIERSTSTSPRTGRADRGAAQFPGERQGAGYRQQGLRDDLQHPLMIGRDRSA